MEDNFGAKENCLLLLILGGWFGKFFFFFFKSGERQVDRFSSVLVFLLCDVIR